MTTPIDIWIDFIQTWNREKQRPIEKIYRVHKKQRAQIASQLRNFGRSFRHHVDVERYGPYIVVRIVR